MKQKRNYSIKSTVDDSLNISTVFKSKKAAEHFVEKFKSIFPAASEKVKLEIVEKKI